MLSACQLNNEKTIKFKQKKNSSVSGIFGFFPVEIFWVKLGQMPCNSPQHFNKNLFIQHYIKQNTAWKSGTGRWSTARDPRESVITIPGAASLIFTAMTDATCINGIVSSVLLCYWFFCSWCNGFCPWRSSQTVPTYTL